MLHKTFALISYVLITCAAFIGSRLAVDSMGLLYRGLVLAGLANTWWITITAWGDSHSNHESQ